jgi:hypothetical protein
MSLPRQSHYSILNFKLFFGAPMLLEKIPVARRLRSSILWSVLVVSTLAGCERLEKYSGSYHGEQIDSSGQTQVIVDIPDLSRAEGQKVLQFKVFSARGNGSGDDYRISLAGRKSIRLYAPTISNNEIELSKKGDCAVGYDSAIQVQLCLGVDVINLDAYSNNRPLFALHLVRGEGSLPPVQPEDRVGREYGLEELMGRVRLMNFTVAQEAEKVYRAKENIAVARGNLLPKLSLRAILGAFTGDYLSTVGAIAPFLFPSNWFQWKSSKDLYQAERMSFASLKGNELSGVEGLYYLIYRDQAVIGQIDEQIDWMEKTKQNLLTEEHAGVLYNGGADFYETSIVKVRKDRISLENLVKTEYAELSQAVGLTAIGGITKLAAIPAPSLDGVAPIDAKDFYQKAQDRSYEVKALTYLIHSTRYEKPDVFFQFLNPEGNGSIGFGTANSFHVVQSKEAELRIRRNEVISSIEVKSVSLASEFNAALLTYAEAKKGQAATEKRLEWLRQRHITGDATLDEGDYVRELTELQSKILEYKLDNFSSGHVLLMSRAKFDRLVLHGFYRNLEDAVPASNGFELSTSMN